MGASELPDVTEQRFGHFGKPSAVDGTGKMLFKSLWEASQKPLASFSETSKEPLRGLCEIFRKASENPPGCIWPLGDEPSNA